MKQLWPSAFFGGREVRRPAHDAAPADMRILPIRWSACSTMTVSRKVPEHRAQAAAQRIGVELRCPGTLRDTVIVEHADQRIGQIPHVSRGGVMRRSPDFPGLRKMQMAIAAFMAGPRRRLGNVERGSHSPRHARPPCLTVIPVRRFRARSRLRASPASNRCERHRFPAER